MTGTRDPDRMIRAFIGEGSERLADPVYDAVRAEIETKRQRVVIGPWRMPAVNKLVPIGLGAAAVVAIVIVGAQVIRPPDSATVAGASAPSAPSSVSPGEVPGGSVGFQMDGGPATTEVTLSDGSAGVSGTAVTTFVAGTHRVRLECATRVGEFWAVAGTVEESTADAEAANAWSMVLVKDGSPQQIAIWLSDPKTDGVDCAGWLAAIDISTIDAENFQPVESGTLVAPPDLAP